MTTLNHLNIDDLLHCATHAPTVASRRNRKYALICLRQFLGADVWPMEQFTRDLLEEFVVWLAKSGKSNATVELYRKELRSVLIDLYPANEKDIKEIFKRPRAPWHARSEGLKLEELRHLSKGEYGPLVQWTRARDLFLVSFYCGGVDFNVLSQLTHDAIADGYLTLPGGLKVRVNANLQALLDEYAVEGDPHLFPFTQRWTDERYREVLRQIAQRYRYRALPQRDSAVTTWIALAKDLGVDFSVMAACAAKRLGVLADYTQPPVAVPQDDIDHALTRVSSAVADMTEHWYAMHLRNGRQPEDIYARLQEHPEHPALRGLITYYPCEDIMHRAGKKFVKHVKAYIEQVLFFRTRPHLVSTLFRLTGDLGWIYRQSNTPSAPYSIISQHEMSNFQSAIAHFTPDIEVSLVKLEDVSVGRRVRVVSGDFAGCEGVILDVAPGDAFLTDLREFVVSFTSENALKIKIRLLESDVELVD